MQEQVQGGQMTLEDAEVMQDFDWEAQAEGGVGGEGGGEEEEDYGAE